MKKILLLLAFVTLAATVPAKADPLSFSNVAALQNNNTTTVDLFSNPGTTLFGPAITFRIDITGVLAPLGTDTLRITFTEAGRAPVVQTFQIPLFGTQPPFTLLFGINSLAATYQGTSAVLIVDLLNSSPDFTIPIGPNAGQRVNSYTYAFNVAQPVPEPATLGLLGAGLAGALASRWKRKR